MLLMMMIITMMSMITMMMKVEGVPLPQFTQPNFNKNDIGNCDSETRNTEFTLIFLPILVQTLIRTPINKLNILRYSSSLPHHTSLFPSEVLGGSLVICGVRTRLARSFCPSSYFLSFRFLDICISPEFSNSRFCSFSSLCSYTNSCWALHIATGRWQR